MSTAGAVDPRTFYAVGDKVISKRHGTGFGTSTVTVTKVTDKSVSFGEHTRINRSRISADGVASVVEPYSGVDFYPAAHPETQSMRLELRARNATALLSRTVATVSRNGSPTTDDLNEIITLATSARDAVFACELVEAQRTAVVKQLHEYLDTDPTISYLLAHTWIYAPNEYLDGQSPLTVAVESPAGLARASFEARKFIDMRAISKAHT